MKDKALYQQILGDTTPWSVSEVALDVKLETVTVRLKVANGTVWGCPKCRERMHIKEWRTRQWRHMDSCQFRTVLEATVPVVECSAHGVQTAQVPWAEGSSRFTLQFERFAIEVLLACSASRAGELLGISWKEADGIKKRAVLRGLALRQLAGLEYVCVDEKAVGRGHDYVTVVTGVFGGASKVLHVGDGRDEMALNGFWERLGPEGCARIRAVSMDMGRPYQNSTRKYCPQADLIFDPFHIMKMLNGAVDQVRRREMLTATLSDRASLKNTRQLWLWGEENLPRRHAEKFEALKDGALKTARAWRIKELWRTFRLCNDSDDARAFFAKWAAEAMRSKLEPIKKVVRTLREHIDGVVSIFAHGFCNALAENVNSRIQLLVQKACGYRNRERLKTDILFHFGGLQLSPLLNQ